LYLDAKLSSVGQQIPLLFEYPVGQAVTQVPFYINPSFTERLLISGYEISVQGCPFASVVLK
jgi:hypothetical protein